MKLLNSHRSSRILALLFLSSLSAFALQRKWGYCEIGGVLASQTPSSPAHITPRVQASYPKCLITVKLTGTSTLATIYSNNNNPPQSLGNPFTADANSYWYFYASDNRYDITATSGGIPVPFTWGDTEVGPDIDTAGRTHGYMQLYNPYSNALPSGTPAPNSILQDMNDFGSQWISVKSFGAIGNGTHDDTAAIQATLDYCYSIGQGAGGCTVYLPAGIYLTGKLVWHGQSIRGDGIGFSVLQGKPGQDILQGQDPADADYKPDFEFSNVGNLSLFVDGTVDVSGTMNRVAGQTTTAGYVWRIGNCAIAGPRSSWDHGGFLFFRAHIHDIEILQDRGTNTGGSTCGIWDQNIAEEGWYSKITIRFTQYGLIWTTPTEGTPTIWAPDENRFSEITTYNEVPFVMVGGSDTNIDGLRIESVSDAFVSGLGLFLLASPNPDTNPGPDGAVIRIREVETNTSSVGEFSQIDGGFHTFLAGTLVPANNQNIWVQWNASNSVINAGLGNSNISLLTNPQPTLKITGHNNKFNLISQFGNELPIYSDTGFSNILNMNGAAVFPPSAPMQLNITKPLPGRHLTSDSLFAGSFSANFLNKEDLLITPADLGDENVNLHGMCSLIVNSSGVPLTQQYCRTQSAGAFGNGYFDGVAGSMTFGDRIPKTIVRAYFVATNEGSSTATQTCTIEDGAGTVMGAGTVNTSNTGYVVSSFLLDTTNAVNTDGSGNLVGMQLICNNNTISAFERIAYIQLVPWNEATLKVVGTWNEQTNGSAFAFDYRRGSLIRANLNQNASFTVSNAGDGEPFTLSFCQNNTGGFTVTWPSTFASHGTVSTTANACSTQQFVYRSANDAYYPLTAMTQ